MQGGQVWFELHCISRLSLFLPLRPIYCHASRYWLFTKSLVAFVRLVLVIGCLVSPDDSFPSSLTDKVSVFLISLSLATPIW